MRCPKPKFPIQIIVLDELEIIVHVIQGLSLQTAIVQPWSKSESKPLSQQAPKSNKSPLKQALRNSCELLRRRKELHARSWYFM